MASSKLWIAAIVLPPVFFVLAIAAAVYWYRKMKALVVLGREQREDLEGTVSTRSKSSREEIPLVALERVEVEEREWRLRKMPVDEVDAGEWSGSSAGTGRGESARTRSSSSLPPPAGYQPPSLFPKSGARSTRTEVSDSSDGRARTTVARGHRVLTKRRSTIKSTPSVPHPQRISRRKDSFGVGEDKDYVADVSDLSDTNPYGASQGRPSDISSSSFLAPPPRSRRHSSTSPSPPSSPDLSPSLKPVIVDRSVTRGARGAIVPPLASHQSLYDSLEPAFDTSASTPHFSDDSMTSRRSKADSTAPLIRHRHSDSDSERPPPPRIALTTPTTTDNEPPQLSLSTSFPYRPSPLAATPLMMSPASPISQTAHPHPSSPTPPPLSPVPTTYSSTNFHSAEPCLSPASPRHISFGTTHPPARAQGRRMSLEQREELEAAARFPHPYEKGLPWMQGLIDSRGSLPLVETERGGLTLTNPDSTTGSQAPTSLNPSRGTSISGGGHEA